MFKTQTKTDDTAYFIREYLSACWDWFTAGERARNSFLGMCLAIYGPAFNSIKTVSELRVEKIVDHVEASSGGMHQVIFLRPKH